jgi:hypothetical protein
MQPATTPEGAIDSFIERHGEFDDVRSPLLEIGLRPSYGRRYSREVLLAVGDECVVASLNPKAKRNRGRKCEILAFAGKIVTMPDYAVVRFGDTRRLGKVDPADLVPVSDPSR